jgi:hypothetical protein
MADIIRTGESINIEKRASASIGAAEMVISGRKVEVMARPEVKDFHDHIDIKKIIEAEAVQKRIVIIDQFPRAGVQVPDGTPVNLTIMYKDTIDIGKMKDMSIEVMDKYKDDKVRKVVEDISSNAEAKKILGAKKEYKDLAEEEKMAMKNYAVEKGIVTSDASEEKVSGVHKDLLFIYNF